MAHGMLKVGFLLILIFLMMLFFNQMPDYLAEYQNYIILGFLVFFGGIFITSIK